MPLIKLKGLMDSMKGNPSFLFLNSFIFRIIFIFSHITAKLSPGASAECKSEVVISNNVGSPCRVEFVMVPS